MTPEDSRQVRENIRAAPPGTHFIIAALGAWKDTRPLRPLRLVRTKAMAP